MIAFLTNEFPLYAGGVATYSYELARAITGQGLPITVIAAQKHANDLTFDRSQSFSIIRVHEHRVAAMRHWSRYQALRSCIIENRPSLLWASDWRAGIVVLSLARQYSIPYAVTAYGTELLIAAASTLRSRIARYVFDHAHIIFCISCYTRQLLIDIGINSSRVKVTPLGISAGDFLPDSASAAEIVHRHNLSGKRVILTLARLTARKGQDIMVQAMPEVIKAIPSAVYVIAGRGEDENRLRKLVADLDLETHVIFAGYVSEEDKPAYYQACDLYVMLSRQEGHFVEGFGLTLLEAGVCAKPVVAGRHGGVPEVVEEGHTGLLVDPCSKEEVAAAVIRMLNNEQLSRKMGDNARRQILREKNWNQTARLSIEALSWIDQCK